MAITKSAAEITARIDRLPSSWAVWRLVVLLSLGGAFEFYDLFQTAYLSPGLISRGIFRTGAKGLFGLSDQAAFASATFAGLFIGTIVFGSVADQWGRRAVFTFSLLWYTAASIVMGLQRTSVGVDLWRLIAGIGIGVELVTIDALRFGTRPGPLARTRLRHQSVRAVSRDSRARVDLLDPGASISAGHGGMALGGVSRRAGSDRGVGHPPQHSGIAAMAGQQGRLEEASAAIAQIERRVEKEIGHALSEPLHTVEQVEGKGKFSEIWVPPYRKRTLMLMVFNFFQTIGFYGFGNWVPALLAPPWARR